MKIKVTLFLISFVVLRLARYPRLRVPISSTPHIGLLDPHLTQSLLGLFLIAATLTFNQRTLKWLGTCSCRFRRDLFEGGTSGNPSSRCRP
jgi:hypothetical protein